MGANYGPFLLEHIPLDAIETEAQCLAVLEQFASKGLCPMFREVIEGRVVEFHYDSHTRTTSYHWLEHGDTNADAVLALYQSGGSAPYSYFEFLEDVGTLLTPGSTPDGVKAETVSLLETEGEIDFTVMSASEAAAIIQKLNTQLQDPEVYPEPDSHRHPLATYLEFHHEFLQGIDE
ncbi:MAG TPA: hypothetical protein VHL11_02900, partial [Phototrophicaceae bacterium]|nr:hypothetical protein [Phototrophicaceae bacterium]